MRYIYEIEKEAHEARIRFSTMNKVIKPLEGFVHVDTNKCKTFIKVTPQHFSNTVLVQFTDDAYPISLYDGADLDKFSDSLTQAINELIIESEIHDNLKDIINLSLKV